MSDQKEYSELTETEKKAIHTKWELEHYGDARALEYPSIESQLDEIYHNGIESWKSVIKVTKDKFPKV